MTDLSLLARQTATYASKNPSLHGVGAEGWANLLVAARAVPPAEVSIFADLIRPHLTALGLPRCPEDDAA